MSEVKDGMCIIDAISGIDCATLQIGQFTDNFDKVKFLLGKDFNDYTMIIVTDINGHVEIVNTDGESLIKESADGETSLVWNIGANITAESGVVIYQIVAYKGDGENIEEVWYSKEGRLIVTESISTNEYSASLIGSYPNLLTRLLIDIDALQKELDIRCNLKVDIIEGMGLSQNSFSDEEKEKLSAIEEGAEVNVASDWQEDDENSDSYIKNKPNLASVAISGSYTDLKDKPIVDNAYNSESQNAQSGTAVAQAIASLINSSPEALNTLYELASALGNDPNFAETVAKQIGTKVDKIEGKVLSSNDYTDAEKEKLASVSQGAERNVISDWAEEDANSDKFIKNKPQLSKVALSGSYNDLSDKPLFASVAKSGSYRDLTDTPQIPSVEGLASEAYVNKGLEGKADKTTKINGKSLSGDIDLTADDVGALPSNKIVEGFGVPFDVSGTNLVTIDKVHPKEHDVEVKLESKNLISPSVFSDYELQEDGSYYAPHANATKKYSFELPAGTYTLSYQCKSSAGSDYRIELLDENGKAYGEFLTSTGDYVSFNYTFTVSADIVSIKFDWGKSSEIGVYFKDLQIEKGSVATPYTPYVDVLADAESVTVIGKNILDIVNGGEEDYLARITKTDNAYTIQNVVNGQLNMYFPILNTGKTYTFYCEFESTYPPRIMKSDKTTMHTLTSGKAQSFSTTEELFYIRFSLEKNETITVTKPQLEIGSVATKWEEFKSETYPVTDGKAIVKRVSPTMNITTSESGVNIEAKGYQDGLAVIDELKQAILSLGGNI